MKKQLIIISLILATVTAFAQEPTQPQAEATQATTEKAVCHHRVNLHVGGAVTNNIYAKSPEIQRMLAMGSSFEIGYTYFFNDFVGLGFGLGVQDLAAKLKTNIHGRVIGLEYGSLQPDRVYDLLYSTNDLIEKQHLLALYVPLTVQFEHKVNGGKNGIYGAIGVQGYFPLRGSSKLANGELITKGYEEYLNVYYQNDMPQHGMGTYDFNGKNIIKTGKGGLRCSIDILGEFGGIFEINNKADFYVGAYASYGFLDILPKPENYHTFVDVAATEQAVKYNGLLGSDYIKKYNTQNARHLKEKFNLLQVGLKVGVHIKPCGKADKSLRKQFYEEMMKRSNEPAKGSSEIVYIIPQCCEETKAEEPKQLLSPIAGKQANKENANLKELADILAVTKILFDLDKDDPKVAKKDDQNIEKVATILKNDPSLVLIVEGYTCILGSEEHNKKLAKRRAEHTRDYFISKGVPADQIETYSYTATEETNIQNIPSDNKEEHRAAIFRIRKR